MLHHYFTGSEVDQNLECSVIEISLTPGFILGFELPGIISYYYHLPLYMLNTFVGDGWPVVPKTLQTPSHTKPPCACSIKAALLHACTGLPITESSDPALGSLGFAGRFRSWVLTRHGAIRRSLPRFPIVRISTLILGPSSVLNFEAVRVPEAHRVTLQLLLKKQTLGDKPQVKEQRNQVIIMLLPQHRVRLGLFQLFHHAV